MNTVLKSALTAAGLAIATQAAAQITFYEGEGFQGRTFTTKKQVGNFERSGFNDRASSVVVDARPVGGLRRRPVQRPVRGPAPGQVSLAGGDGLERPRFVGADGQQERTCRR